MSGKISEMAGGPRLVPAGVGRGTQNSCCSATMCGGTKPNDTALVLCADDAAEKSVGADATAAPCTTSWRSSVCWGVLGCGSPVLSSIAKHIVMSSSPDLGSVWCVPAPGDRDGSDDSPEPLGVCGRLAGSSCCFCCCAVCRTFWMYLRRTESTIVVSEAVVVCDDIPLCSVVQQNSQSGKKTQGETVTPT